MISRGIPCLSDENGTRGTKRPQTIKTTQVSYRPSISSDQEIRRASEQTSPQVARAVGQTRKAGRGRRVDQWQQINSPSLVSGGKTRQKAQVEGESLGRRFRGESDHKVDSKGRVSIPASFRRVIESYSWCGSSTGLDWFSTSSTGLAYLL